MGSACRYCDEAWHRLAGKSYPKEQRLSPDALRKHVHSQEWDDEVTQCFFSYCPVGEAPVFIAAWICGLWQSSLSRTDKIAAFLAACEARMVQGMFRYGDAWATDEWPQCSLSRFANARLSRYWTTHDQEMLFDAANGMRMIWYRMKMGLD